MKTRNSSGPEVFDANGNPLNEVIVKPSPVAKILFVALIISNIITAYSWYKADLEYQAIDQQYEAYFGEYVNPITYEPITSAKSYLEAFKAQESLANTEVTYILDRNNRVFHISECEYANKININYRSSVVSTVGELKQKGYRPCQYCIKE